MNSRLHLPSSPRQPLRQRQPVPASFCTSRRLRRLAEHRGAWCAASRYTQFSIGPACSVAPGLNMGCCRSHPPSNTSSSDLPSAAGRIGSNVRRSDLLMNSRPIFRRHHGSSRASKTGCRHVLYIASASCASPSTEGPNSGAKFALHTVFTSRPACSVALVQHGVLP